MMQLENTITTALTAHGASLIRFIDVRDLPMKQNRSLPNAIFFGIPLTRPYMRKVLETPDYVETIIAQNKIESDEFHLTEMKAGEVADQITALLVSKGYQAYSQSDTNLIATNAWDAERSETPLPHKTIAVLAGVGWIGKSNLLVTPEYGSGLCMSTVLTDAPLQVTHPLTSQSKCGACRKCVNVCPTNALRGTTWEKGCSREDIVDIHKCTTCLKCMMHCPYTRKFINFGD